MNYRIFAILFILVCVWSCTPDPNTNPIEPPKVAAMHTSFYVGTYTFGDSKGIYKYSIDETGQLSAEGLVAEASNPSFLSKSGDYLLAVNENEDGSIQSFKITPDSLIHLNTSPTGGAHPCFVTLDEYGHVLVANYTGGNIGYLTLSDNGYLSDLLDVQQHEGSGPTDRQEGPHAHSVWFAPVSGHVLAVDLGTDEIWTSYLLEEKERLVHEGQKLKLNPGAGPRHLCFLNEERLFVLNELDGTVANVQINETGDMQVDGVYPTLPTDFDGFNTCADIHLSADGQFLYASNRGHDSIVIFKVGKDGHLEHVGFESTRGATPRNFTLSPDGAFLLVANQEGNNIVSFKRDSERGTLSFVSSIEAPNPVCLLF